MGCVTCTFKEDSYMKSTRSVNGLRLKILSLFQALYNSVLEKTQTIEQVNVVGGRFIREAKVRC